MAGDKVGGTMKGGGAGQLAGGFASGMQGGRANPPAPQTNPMVYDTPGDYLFGIPKGVTVVTVEQWGAGGSGGEGGTAAGGKGGGGGAYSKYTFGEPLFAAGGVLTVAVGGPVSDFTPGGASGVICIGHTPRVVSQGGISGHNGGAGATNIVVAGAGLTVLTDTAGAAGAAAVGKVGGDGGDGGGAGGGAGGAGGADTKAGAVGSQPGGGGGGAGANNAGKALAGAGKLVISW